MQTSPTIGNGPIDHRRLRAGDVQEPLSTTRGDALLDHDSSGVEWTAKQRYQELYSVL